MMTTSGNAKVIKHYFRENYPPQFADRGLMIRRPEKMKVKTLHGELITWPKLEKKHQVLLLGPIRTQTGKLPMTDEHATKIFQSIGYKKEDVYRLPHSGLVVFVQDFRRPSLKQLQHGIPKSKVSLEKQQQQKQIKQQEKQQQKSSSLVRPTPVRHKKKSPLLQQQQQSQHVDRAFTLTPRPITPLRKKKLF